HIGTWTDVYLLGGVLYFLLTGTVPHPGRTIVAIEHARSGRFDPPSERAPGRAVPHDLEELCRRAMASDPRQRLASSDEFLQALQAHLSGARLRQDSQELTAAARVRLGAVSADYR